ncbi:TraR/DksA family transcriptional regulator [Streptomyces sp. NPDC059783]|uniref:TraR/DksA family transcriptional regulator n=1 Tax=Streptomyces sp. NPDC059783 TaxID=3346944 RepID=UPI00365815B7
MVAKKTSDAKAGTEPQDVAGAPEEAADPTPGETAAATGTTKRTAKKTAAKKTAARKTTKKTAKTAKKTADSAKKAAGSTAAGKRTAAGRSTARTASKEAAEAATGAAEAAEQTGAHTVVAKKSPARTRTADRSTAPVPPARAATAPEELAVRPGEDPWTPEEVAEARTGLTGEITRLRSELEASGQALAGLMRDSGDGAGDDEADTGTKNITREHEMQLAANAQEMLEQTERALARLDAGTYGLCEICGKPIGKARMQAFPRATLCVEDKQKQERRG